MSLSPRYYYTFILLISLLLGSLSQSYASGLGHISGVVPLPKPKTSTAQTKKYFGKISGKVSPAPSPVAGVWLESNSLSAPKKTKPLSLSQSGYQFSQHLIVVPKGTSVSFPNKDPDFHNIYSLSRPKRFDLGRYKKGETPQAILFDKEGFIALHCEIHEHMRANIIVVDSPYYSVTSSRGAFTLKNIPAGKYTLHAQISRKVKWSLPVTVQAGKSLSVVFPEK